MLVIDKDFKELLSYFTREIVLAKVKMLKGRVLYQVTKFVTAGSSNLIVTKVK